MSKPAQGTWNPRRMFDMSLEEQKAVEERRHMREQLKQEFMKKQSSPYRGTTGHLVSHLIFAFILISELLFSTICKLPNDFSDEAREIA